MYPLLRAQVTSTAFFLSGFEWIEKKLSVRTAYYQVGIGIFCVLPCDDGMKLAEGWETEKHIDYIGTKVNADFPFLPENPR